MPSQLVQFKPLTNNCATDGCKTNMKCDSESNTCVYETGYNSDGSCATGYTLIGTQCQIAMTTENQKTECESNGIVVGSDGKEYTTGDAFCSCTTGFKGVTCMECSSGYQFVTSTYGSTCNNKSGCYADNYEQLGNSLCTLDAETGLYRLKCNEDFYFTTLLIDGKSVDVCAKSTTCAFATGDVCSNHGNCTTDSADGAICCCNAAYQGAKCDACATGYADFKGVCYPKESCIFEGYECLQDAVCDVCNGVATCKCPEGYAGDRCENCDKGYEKINGVCVKKAQNPDSCVSPEVMSLGVCYTPESCNIQDQRCNLHGSCNICNGVGTCKCWKGWKGEYCGEEETCDKDCHHGACQYTNSAKVDMKCECYEHYEGEDCQIRKCDLNCVYGTCELDSASGEPKCKCVDFNIGEVCDQCPEGYEREGSTCRNPNSCANTCQHGSCNDEDCRCATGYTGEHCELCDADNLYYQEVATGDCVIDKCLAGTFDCSAVKNTECKRTDDTYSCACATGFKDYNGKCISDYSCVLEGNECNKYSTCTEAEDTYSWTCVCKAHHIGNKCLSCQAGYSKVAGACIPNDSCYFSGHDCQNAGVCNLDVATESASCTCPTGYLGDFCTECDTAAGYLQYGTRCYPSDSCLFGTHPCNDNGSCEFDETHPPECVCKKGATGTECSKCADGYQYNKDYVCVKSNSVQSALLYSGIAAAVIIALSAVAAVIVRKYNSNKKAQMTSITSSVDGASVISDAADESVAAEQAK